MSMISLLHNYIIISRFTRDDHSILRTRKEVDSVCFQVAWWVDGGCEGGAIGDTDQLGHTDVVRLQHASI